MISYCPRIDTPVRSGCEVEKLKSAIRVSNQVSYSRYVLTATFFEYSGRIFQRGIVRTTLEFSQSKVGEFYHPARIHQTIGRVQGAVKTYRGLVQVYHSLKHNSKTEYTFKFDHNFLQEPVYIRSLFKFVILGICDS